MFTPYFAQAFDLRFAIGRQSADQKHGFYPSNFVGIDDGRNSILELQVAPY
jgi:hypothetical protein